MLWHAHSVSEEELQRRSERINRGQEQMRLTRQSSGLFPRKMSAANLLNALKPDRVADESSESESEVALRTLTLTLCSLAAANPDSDRSSRRRQGRR